MKIRCVQVLMEIDEAGAPRGVVKVISDYLTLDNDAQAKANGGQKSRWSNGQSLARATPCIAGRRSARPGKRRNQGLGRLPQSNSHLIDCDMTVEVRVYSDLQHEHELDWP
jgi:hypothetical protein